MEALLADDVVFTSPVAFKPYRGKAITAAILRGVVRVFEDFRYHRQFAHPNGLNVVLEFTARVQGKELKGIDMIAFDAEGRITDFEVMVRPMSGLQALGEEMGKRLAPYLAAMGGAKDKKGGNPWMLLP